MAQATAPILDSTIASAANVLSLRQLSSELRKFDDRQPCPALARLTRSGREQASIECWNR
jgi:hypothetical protein